MYKVIYEKMKVNDKRQVLLYCGFTNCCLQILFDFLVIYTFQKQQKTSFFCMLYIPFLSITFKSTEIMPVGCVFKFLILNFVLEK